ncbi:hypothetical protein GMOD_00009044 [Pyrenophora seminiperda CCB06]|uniref:Uncharacterized protein n=1 Tax=Pyrenophora seminiperda CCB06 TaxID=1302712 RepID=A0A3M7MFU3_9PLEO|nr:hypothetical protein GMOD_00009044 [Pyrenophora seminiperda CCB06]
MSTGIDSHPRLLALSLSPSPRNSTSTPTPTASANPSQSSTPLATSRRASHDSAHDAHHFVNLDAAAEKEQHEHKFNASLKKMWAGVKKHAAEHHRSVNAAYMASYGGGVHAGRY